MTRGRWHLPEIWFALGFLALTLATGGLLGFAFRLPQGNEASFVGIHYLYPLIGLAAWGGFALIGQRARLARTFLIALPCYAVVLACHFNLKLWGPFINPTSWDDIYWRIDVWFRPLVDACIAARVAIAPLIPLNSNFYITAFITLFYVSFCFHALRSPHQFRTLFLAALIFQGTGALAYLVAPAVGPFTFEAGIEPLQTNAQHSMLAIREQFLVAGAPWIDAYGGASITAGLAAMPSLHTGGSFLFLLFAWRYARVLVPVYLPLFAFISIDAIATRWHYLIDLPAGVALALACAWAAEKLNPRMMQAKPTRYPASAPDPVIEFLVRLRRKFSVSFRKLV